MRGQRDKQAAETAPATTNAIEIIDVSEHKRRRIPSAKWRELIKKVWEADPLMCPKCSREMRIISLIDDRQVIKRILEHLGLWPALRSLGEGGEEGILVTSGTDPPGQTIVEPWFDDPFPDYDAEPVMCANS